MSADKTSFRLIPSVDSLLRLQEGSLQESISPALASEAARALVIEIRTLMQKRWPPPGGEASVLDEDMLEKRLGEIRSRLQRPFHVRVLNATGILLHTGLGRAPIPDKAREAMLDVSSQGIVEVDPVSGKRNRREAAVAAQMMALTGAPAALFVNNNAGATLLALDCLARDKEVPASRGELVEIGGGFRMPEVMARAGCQLVEIGATNRTRLCDYEAAINENTGCLMKVHPSNYRIEGFSEEVSLEELVTLGRKKNLPVFEDLGSGYLLKEALPHDAREPSVHQSLAAGVDLVCFSGDKLFGSCQAGILLGREDLVQACARHPLYRALRLDKLALAALEATCLIYRFGEPKQEIPVLRAIFASAKSLKLRAQSFAAALKAPTLRLGYEVTVQESLAYVGSGASPARSLPSYSVAVSRSSQGGNSARSTVLFGLEELARELRLCRPSVWGRIEDDALFLDLRSLAPGDEDLVVQSFNSLGP